MSDRERELAEHRATLRLRCAVQRRAIATEVQGIETRLATVDRIAMVTRTFATHPAVIAVGVIAAVVLARTRGFRVLGHALVMGSGVRRLFRLFFKT